MPIFSQRTRNNGQRYHTLRYVRAEVPHPGYTLVHIHHPGYTLVHIHHPGMYGRRDHTRVCTAGGTTPGLYTCGIYTTRVIHLWDIPTLVWEQEVHTRVWEQEVHTRVCEQEVHPAGYVTPG